MHVNRLFFLFSFMAFSATAQLSVSMAYDRRSEGDIQLAKHFYNQRKEDPRIQNFYGGGVAYESTNRVLVSFGLLFCNNGGSLLHLSEAHTYEGDGNILHRRVQTSDQRIYFRGTNVKLGIEHVVKWKSILFPSLESHISYGGQVQFDGTWSLRNDVGTVSTSFYSSFGQPQQQLALTSTETELRESAIVKKRGVFSIGVVVNKKWVYKSVFFNAGVSTGIMSDRRFEYPNISNVPSGEKEVHDNYGYYLEKRSRYSLKSFYVTTGVSLGYTFQLKKPAAPSPTLQDDPELRPGI